MPRAPREQRISRARGLIREHPEWGRNRVAGALRSEFGVGLRYTTLGGLKREIAPRRIKAPPAAPKRVFRTRRQRRYEVLTAAGFVPFEARPLSKVPFRVPYIDAMIKERYRDMQRAIKAGWSRVRWIETIRRDYIGKGWTRRTALGRRVYDPWKMLRQFEDRYKEKHPEYESPWQKRQRDFRNFVRKLEKTIEKYPSRMPKVKLRYLPEGGAEIVRE